jgi:hypothetical protein
LSIPKRGIRDEDLFGWIDEDKFVIEFHPANLIIWKGIPVKVWLLDIQEGKLFYRRFALKCLFLSGDGHAFSSPKKLELQNLGIQEFRDLRIRNSPIP